MRGLVLVGLLLASCGGGAPVAVATASPTPVSTLAVSTSPPPTPTPSPSPSPSPTAEKILADSYAAMQKVTSVKTVATRDGQPRQLSGANARKLGRMTEVTQLQVSPDHGSDSLSRITTSFSDGTRFSVVRIGAKLWSKIDRIDSGGQVTSAGSWQVSEVILRLPSPFFGKVLDPILDSRAFELQAESRNLDGLEQKAGVMAHRVTLSGRTNDRGQAALRGAVTSVLWIEAATMRWVAEEVTTKWDDTGETYTSNTTYSDYDKDQGIRPPPGF